MRLLFAGASEVSFLSPSGAAVRRSARILASAAVTDLPGLVRLAASGRFQGWPSRPGLQLVEAKAWRGDTLRRSLAAGAGAGLRAISGHRRLQGPLSHRL